MMTPTLARAVLFDFDGTLADSFSAITASVNYVSAHYGARTWTEEEIRPRVGWGLPHLMEELFPDHPAEESVALYRTHHPKVMYSGTHLLPGVADLLAQLRQRRCLTAVCSNKAVAFTKELLGVLHINYYFDEVLGPEDVGGRAKPHPDMVIEALRRLDVDPRQSVYIGDMEIDVRTARQAGVPIWVVPTGTQNADRLRAAQPDRFFRDMGELAPALLAAVPPMCPQPSADC